MFLNHQFANRPFENLGANPNIAYNDPNSPYAPSSPPHSMALPIPRSGDWAKIIEFAPPKQGDTTGLINLKGARSIQLTNLANKPLNFRKPALPLEINSVSEFMSKGRGNLSIAVELDSNLWNIFNELDMVFQAFLVENARKLFSPKDADFIARDKSAIALKHPKPLARFKPDGTPDHSTLLRFRISGRGPEVTGFDVKEGARDGTYTTNVTYKDQTDALPFNATRMCMVTGVTESGDKKVATLLRRTNVASAGAGDKKMRYVGPGDMRDGVIVDAKFTVSHWALVNGSASICLRMTDIIFENTEAIASVPEGFVLANEEDTPPPILFSPVRRVPQDPVAPGAPTKRSRFEHSSSSLFSPRPSDKTKDYVASILKWDERFPDCEGCKNQLPDQKSHMKVGGCLHDSEFNEFPEA